MNQRFQFNLKVLVGYVAQALLLARVWFRCSGATKSGCATPTDATTPRKFVTPACPEGVEGLPAGSFAVASTGTARMAALRDAAPAISEGFFQKGEFTSQATMIGWAIRSLLEAAPLQRSILKFAQVDHVFDFELDRSQLDAQ
jgi:hypothetical protein